MPDITGIGEVVTGAKDSSQIRLRKKKLKSQPRLTYRKIKTSLSNFKLRLTLTRLCNLECTSGTVQVGSA